MPRKNGRGRVAEVMVRELATLESDARIADAVELMRSRQVREVLVTRGGRLEGLLTERELREYLPAGAHHVVQLSVESRVHLVMARKPLALAPDDGLDVALDLMVDNRVQVLPVVDDDGFPVGLLNLYDAARGLRLHRGQGAAVAVDT